MQIVSEAHLEPWRSLWGENRGPLVDTETDVFGRVYVGENEAHDILILFPDLVGRLAAELGWVPPAEVDALLVESDRLRGEIGRLEAGQPKVLSLDEARAYLAADRDTVTSTSKGAVG